MCVHKRNSIEGRIGKNKKRINKYRYRPGLKSDESGLSSVITIGGIIAAIMGFVIAPILTVYVPMWTKDAEAEHMSDTADSFSTLRGNINKMIERNKVNGQSDIRLKLGTELNNYFLPDSTGTLYLRPNTPEFSIYNADNSMDLYAKGAGSIEYLAQNHEYSDQRFIYENGAVLKEQSGQNTMDLVPKMDIQKHTAGKVLLEDDDVKGNMPGYDTTRKNGVEYDFTGITGDISLKYDLYNNDNYIYETDFNQNIDEVDWDEHTYLNDWYIERRMDTPNIIAQWSFSEHTTSATFEEKSPGTSTLKGDFRNNPLHAEGKYGDSIELVGASSQRIIISSLNAIEFDYPHNIECWIYPYDVVGSKYIVSKLKDASFSGYGLLQVGSEMRYVLGTGSSYYSLDSTGANLKANEWTHIAGVWDGTKMYVYINGVKLGETPFAGPISTSQQKLVFGSNQAENGNFYNGRLDEVIFSSYPKTTFDYDGIFSTRGDLYSSPYDSVATLEYYANWIPPYNSIEWQYRKMLTIPSTQVAGTLTDFPLMVKLTDTDLKTYARSDGYDILFTSADAETKLDHEIERFVPSTGELIAWVRIPELSATQNNVIYMYFGHAAAPDQSNSDGVWDDNFVGVWHMGEFSLALVDEFKDSSIYNNHGRGGSGIFNYIPVRVDGKIGKGQRFDGTDDHINCGVDPSLNIIGSEITLQAWINFPGYDLPGEFQGIMAHDGWDAGYRMGFRFTGNHPYFHLPEDESWLGASQEVSLDTWVHLVGVYDGSSMKIYIDGVKDANEQTKSNNVELSANEFWIGHGDNSVAAPWSYPFDGMIDEVRVSDTARSEDWIETEYTNQNNYNNFYIIGGLEDIDTVAKYDLWEIESLNLDWQYRKRVTVKSSLVEDDLTDFPVVISTTDLDLQANARSDAYDIFFTLSDGTTKLDHEVELYDSATGQFVAWVKVPFLSSTVDTELYMYYGNPTASDQSNSLDVWSSGYEAIWHLSESTGSGYYLKDATGNGYDGDPIGASFKTAGKVDGCRRLYDNQDSRIVITNGGALLNGWDNFTVEFWMDPAYGDDWEYENSASDGADDVFNKGVSMTGARTWREAWQPTNTAFFQMDIQFETFGWEYRRMDVDRRDYTYCVYTYNGTAYTLYQDGIQVYNNNIPNDKLVASTNQFYFGSSTDPYHGYIDEVRLSTVSYSPEWFKTQFNNQYLLEGFYTISPQEDLNSFTGAYNNAWKYRKPITIDSAMVSQDLTNFPVLIELTDPDLKSKARSDGYDILFTSSDGFFKLDHEFEVYDSSTGYLRAWVKVPSLSSTIDTELYMYYGNPAADNQQNPDGVWADYSFVLHFNEDPSTSDILDSSSNNADFSPGILLDTNDLVDGKIGKALRFEGGSDGDYIYIDTSKVTWSGPTDMFSLEFWLNQAEDTTSAATYVSLPYPTGTEDFPRIMSNGRMHAWIKNGGTWDEITTTTTVYAIGDWYHFIVSYYDGNGVSGDTKYRFYVNGDQERSEDADPDLTTPHVPWNTFAIGADDDNNAGTLSNSEYKGLVDEFRVYHGWHDVGWAFAEYNNQNSPSTFYTVGSEQDDFRKKSAIVYETQMSAYEFSGNPGDAYMIFDYKSDTNFKYAGLSANADMWFIGHRLPSGYYDNATLTETVDYDKWYNVSLEIIDKSVQLFVDGVYKLQFEYENRITGKFGLATYRSHSHYDNLKIYYKNNNGIEIWVNGQYISDAASTMAYQWSNTNQVTINSKYLKADSMNKIEFKNSFSRSKSWAVRNIEIKGHPKEEISLITIACEEKTVGGSDSHVVHTRLLRRELNQYDFYPANVTLSLTTRYHDAWWEYFNNKLNETDNNLKWYEDKTLSDYFMWSSPEIGDTRTIYITFTRINILNCIIAVIDATVD
jgi:hypothetical protein